MAVHLLAESEVRVEALLRRVVGIIALNRQRVHGGVSKHGRPAGRRSSCARWRAGVLAMQPAVCCPLPQRAADA